MAVRTDEEWIVALGEAGSLEQAQAFADLGRYLYVVVYNYLLKRQGDTRYLSGLASSDLENLAGEFVQRTLVTDWQKLSQYKRHGRFTSWAAKIAINEARQELRKGDWQRWVPLPAGGDQSAKDDEIEPEDALSYLDLHGVEQELCAEQCVRLEEIFDVVRETASHVFSEAQRLAFRGRFLLEQGNQELAEAIGCARNRVYGLVYECRAILKGRLEDAGYALQDVYAIFDKGA